MDDWSLKNKDFMVDDGYALLSCHDVEDNEKGLYNASDIETLHKTLIDDIDLFINNQYIIGYQAEKFIFYNEIKKIINKRFGVDK